MKNKSKEYKILLLYDILATSDCLCSASPAYTTILQLGPIKLQQPADRLLQKPVKRNPSYQRIKSTLKSRWT